MSKLNRVPCSRTEATCKKRSPVCTYGSLQVTHDSRYWSRGLTLACADQWRSDTAVNKILGCHDLCWWNQTATMSPVLQSALKTFFNHRKVTPRSHCPDPSHRARSLKHTPHFYKLSWVCHFRPEDLKSKSLEASPTSDETFSQLTHCGPQRDLRRTVRLCFCCEAT